MLAGEEHDALPPEATVFAKVYVRFLAGGNSGEYVNLELETHHIDATAQHQNLDATPTRTYCT